MDINGVININKPEGLTSHDVVARLRRRLSIKRIGHTGTLDPMAVGVLPVCIGKATRIIEYYDADMKSYHAGVQLGIRTDTLDITGEIIERNPIDRITEVDILDAARHFDGEVSQTPPKYSALKVNGKRLYEYARQGIDVEIKSRIVRLEGMSVTNLDLNKGTFEFDVTCSKGTYIRTIVDDIGQMLGCGATMTTLTRTRSGVFNLGNSYPLEDVLNMADSEIEDIVIDSQETLVNLGVIELNVNRLKAFCNGMSTRAGGYVVKSEGVLKEYKVYSDERFIGIGDINNGELIPLKVMYNANI